MRRVALLPLLFIAGCALPLSGTDLTINDFELSDDGGLCSTTSDCGLNVSAAASVITCDITIVTTGDAGLSGPVLDAGCQFISPAGRRTSCIAHSGVGDVWSCDAPFSKSVEAGTWAIEYVFVRDINYEQVQATNANLVAGSLPGVPNAAALDVVVTSPTDDTSGPYISDYTALPVTVAKGGTVTVTVTADDSATGGSSVLDTGATFEATGEADLSCIKSGGGACDLNIPAGADAGVTFNEKNHFARDTLGNITLVEGASFFCVSGVGCDMPSASIHAGTGGNSGTLYDACDDAFIPIGVNHHGFIGSYPDGIPDTNLDGSAFAEIAKTGATAVKIAWGSAAAATSDQTNCYNHPYRATDPPCAVTEDQQQLFIDGHFAWTGTASLEIQVQAAIDAGLIPIITIYDAIGTSSTTAIDDVVTFLTAPAQSAWFKGIDANGVSRSEYIILNVSVEPDFGTEQDYIDVFEDAVTDLRAEGYTFPLMLDGNGWGSDPDSLANGMPTWLAADPLDNLIASWHTYTVLTTPQITTAMATLAGLGVPVIVSEFTASVGGSPQPYPISCGGSAAPYEEIISQSNTNGFGWLPWSWGGGPDGVDPNSYWNNDFNLGCWSADMTNYETCASLERWGCTVGPAIASAVGADYDPAVSPNRSEYIYDRCGTLTTRTDPGPCGDSCDVGGACDGYEADYVANNGWSATQTTTTAWTTLVADFYAQATVANQDGGFGISDGTPIDDWDPLPITFRFGSSGRIEVVHDSDIYGCDGCEATGTCCPTYALYDWYHFVITTNLIDEEYTVQVENCDDGLVTIATDFNYRDLAGAIDSLSYHGAWDNSGNDFGIYDMTWTPTGSPPTGSISVDTAGLTAGCTDGSNGLLWSISPGGYSGSGNFGPQSVADDDYTITWADWDIDCLIPQSAVAGQQTLTVSDDAQTFELPYETDKNYTLLTARSASVDIQQDGSGGVGGGFGYWNASSDAPFGGDYSDSGVGDGSLAATIRDGRDYTVSFSAETGFDTPSPAGFTGQATPQVAVGNYITGTGGTGGAPVYFWQDEIQTGSGQYGFHEWLCEHPIGNVVTCSDGNGANLSRVANPTGGAGGMPYAVRQFGTFNDSDGARSELGVWSFADQDFYDAVMGGDPVYVAQEWYLPEAFGAAGEAAWLNMWDWHATLGGERYHTCPGLFICDSGCTSMTFRWEWNCGTGQGQSSWSTVTMPVGEWFDIEMQYNRSVSNATTKLWINGVLALQQTGMSSMMSGSTASEMYIKMYGRENGADWTPEDMIKYVRNVRMSTSPITH